MWFSRGGWGLGAQPGDRRSTVASPRQAPRLRGPPRRGRGVERTGRNLAKAGRGGTIWGWGQTNTRTLGSRVAAWAKKNSRSSPQQAPGLRTLRRRFPRRTTGPFLATTTQRPNASGSGVEDGGRRVQDCTERARAVSNQTKDDELAIVAHVGAWNTTGGGSHCRYVSTQPTARARCTFAKIEEARDTRCPWRPGRAPAFSPPPPLCFSANT